MVQTRNQGKAAWREKPDPSDDQRRLAGGIGQALRPAKAGRRFKRPQQRARSALDASSQAPADCVASPRQGSAPVDRALVAASPESSSSSPADTGNPQRSSRHTTGKHIAGPSSVRLRRGIAGRRSRRSQSLPARLPDFQLVELSRMTQRIISDSEVSDSQSASPARSMEGTKTNGSLDKLILTALARKKKDTQENGYSWDPHDAEVLHYVNSIAPKIYEESFLKQRIQDLETAVKNYWEHNEKIVDNKDQMLDVFSYVVARVGKKRILDGEHGSATQHCSKRSTGSDSVDNHLAGLVEQRAVLKGLLEQNAAVEEMMRSPVSIERCIKKLQSCNFSGRLLNHAIDILKLDLELRQAFMTLDHKAAKNYICHVLDKAGFM